MLGRVVELTRLSMAELDSMYDTSCLLIHTCECVYMHTRTQTEISSTYIQKHMPTHLYTVVNACRCRDAQRHTNRRACNEHPNHRVSCTVRWEATAQGSHVRTCCNLLQPSSSESSPPRTPAPRLGNLSRGLELYNLRRHGLQAGHLAAQVASCCCIQRNSCLEQDKC